MRTAHDYVRLAEHDLERAAASAGDNVDEALHAAPLAALLYARAQVWATLAVASGVDDVRLTLEDPVLGD